MTEILLGTKNSYKAEKLAVIVGGHFRPVVRDDLPEVVEEGGTFIEIAQRKAAAYSEAFGGYALSTDGGAVIPALPGWDPLRTRRFGETDRERIDRLLEMMSGVENRTVEWHEAIALAYKGKVLFSAQAKAMDGVIEKTFDPACYREGIWLCSVTAFPQFEGRNYFELSESERQQTEDSWQKLGDDFREFMTRKDTPFLS